MNCSGKLMCGYIQCSLTLLQRRALTAFVMSDRPSAARGISLEGLKDELEKLAKENKKVSCYGQVAD